MSPSSSPLALLVLLALNPRSAANSAVTVYRTAGGEVVLQPGSVDAPITSITWKHGPDIAMEFLSGNTEAYRQFKVRGSLNTSTGALTITDLTQGDSGSYTAEINNRVTGQTQLLVMSSVSKPSITTQCSLDNCVFTCESNTTRDEPVRYSWLVDGKPWKDGNEYSITISREDISPQATIRCSLANPVSSKLSDAVDNPFTTPTRARTPLVISILCVITLISVLVILYLKRRREAQPGRPSEEDLPLMPLNQEQIFEAPNHINAEGGDPVQPGQTSAGSPPVDLSEAGTKAAEVVSTEVLGNQETAANTDTSSETEASCLMPPNQEQNSQAPNHIKAVEANHVQTSSDIPEESGPPGPTEEPLPDVSSDYTDNNEGGDPVQPGQTSAGSPPVDLSEAGTKAVEVVSTEVLGNQETAANTDTSSETAAKLETQNQDQEEAEQDVELES